VTWVGVIVNALLVALKFLAGILGHSHALIADAVHSISDFFSDAVVLLGLHFGRKAPDADHHFGHARVETLASGLVGLSLLGAAVFLGVDAVRHIYGHTLSQPTWLAMVGALVSLVIKESLYHYSVRIGRRIRSPAVVANAWHHRSDALSSLAVALGIGGAMISPDWQFLDCVAALVVAMLIARVGLRFVVDVIKEITDTAPPPEVIQEIRECIESVPGVLGEHDVKVRYSGGLYMMHVHIEVDGQLRVVEGHRIAKEVESCLLRDIEEAGDVIVHVDPVDSDAGEKRPE